MTRRPKKRQQPFLALQPDDASAESGHDDRSAVATGIVLAGPADKKAKPLAKRVPKKKSIKAPKKQKQRAPAAEPASVPAAAGHEDRLARLDKAVRAVRSGEHVSPRTAKLLGSGVPKMAQKLMEEAAGAAIDAVRDERAGFVNESADLLYNLVVLWSALGVAPDEVWAEMDRREALLGMAEKLPKADDAAG